jgi:hypothetical protein
VASTESTSTLVPVVQDVGEKSQLHRHQSIEFVGVMAQYEVEEFMLLVNKTSATISLRFFSVRLEVVTYSSQNLEMRTRGASFVLFASAEV